MLEKNLLSFFGIKNITFRVQRVGGLLQSGLVIAILSKYNLFLFNFMWIWPYIHSLIDLIAVFVK